MSTTIKVRGIYATALTHFFIARGFTVVSPSALIKKRFEPDHFFPEENDPEVFIHDNDAGQAIEIEAGTQHLEKLATLFRKHFPDAVFVTPKKAGIQKILFPRGAKSRLDDLRNEVVPTLIGHHRFKCTESSDLIDLVEKHSLPRHLEKRKHLSRNAERGIVWKSYETDKIIAIEHIKPGGKIITLSPGKIIGFFTDSGQLVLKREGFKSPGKYDGFDIPICDGDYCQTRIESNQWYYHHAYFRRDGTPIGEYWNVNTPIEFYPDKVSYVDLEIDVVKWPDGRVEIIDGQLLKECFESGAFGRALFEKAAQVAEALFIALGGKQEKR